MEGRQGEFKRLTNPKRREPKVNQAHNTANIKRKGNPGSSRGSTMSETTELRGQPALLLSGVFKFFLTFFFIVRPPSRFPSALSLLSAPLCRL